MHSPAVLALATKPRSFIILQSRSRILSVAAATVLRCCKNGPMLKAEGVWTCCGSVFLPGSRCPDRFERRAAILLEHPDHFAPPSLLWRGVLPSAGVAGGAANAV